MPIKSPLDCSSPKHANTAKPGQKLPVKGRVEAETGKKQEWREGELGENACETDKEGVRQGDLGRWKLQERSRNEGRTKQSQSEGAGEGERKEKAVRGSKGDKNNYGILHTAGQSRI